MKMPKNEDVQAINKAIMDHYYKGHVKADPSLYTTSKL